LELLDYLLFGRLALATAQLSWFSCHSKHDKIAYLQRELQARSWGHEILAYSYLEPGIINTSVNCSVVLMNIFHSVIQVTKHVFPPVVILGF